MFFPPAIPFRFKQPLERSQAQRSAAVLLVEDEPSIARMLTGVLAKTGLDVIWARDVAEGLGMFEQNPQGFALAFVDCHRQEIEDSEFCQRVRAINPELPVLFAGTGGPQSGHPWPVVGRHTEYVPKPFLPTELAWKMRALVGRATG